ncbi:MAG: hypothetical protein ABSF15_16525 [Candidatus Sulfotelmatobacter sp.]
MLATKMKVSQKLGFAVIALLACSGLAGAQRLTPIPRRGATRAQSEAGSNNPGLPWTPLTNQPIFIDDVNCAGASNPLLLTDGTVIVQSGGCQEWWRLTPDDTGSYVNGTWSQLASLPSDYSPLYHSSAVLPDGRVIIMGGEYNFFNPVWTNLGAIYDPIANTWTPVVPPSGWSTIGDAQSVVLANGTYMQANCCTTQSALLNAGDLTWTPTGTGKYDPNDEEGWNLLPNGKVLAVDAYVPIPPFPYIPAGTNSELYNPWTGSWSSAGSTIVQLWDSAIACGGENDATFELGPAVLRPDGTVFYTGADTCELSAGPPPVFANGNTAIYNTRSGRWTPGPTFTGGNNIADGSASLEINGKVLMMASPGYGDPPSTFFEWDGRNLYTVPGTPNAPTDGSYYGNMLMLPSGQVLLTDFSDDIELYTPRGGYQPEWAPVVLGSPFFIRPGGSYQIYGFRFNGMSQGAAYGDDVQAATNYPLVRITNLHTGHVFYSRTYDHSSMAVASHDLVSTHFNVPVAQERGLSRLEVVANGIPSSPALVYVK